MLLSTSQAAARTGISTNRVAAACKSGRLPASQDTQGRWWIEENDFRNFVKAQRAQTTATDRKPVLDLRYQQPPPKDAEAAQSLVNHVRAGVIEVSAAIGLFALGDDFEAFWNEQVAVKLHQQSLALDTT